MQGWQKTSFIDYPGKIASVIFYAGCNFRCPYCHNRELVFSKDGTTNVSESEAIAKISKNKHLYEGVVITGGEPLLIKNIEEIIIKIKEETGLPVKIDTNGTSPDVLESLVSGNLVDYVAMDVKTSLEKYSLVFFNQDESHELIKKLNQSVSFLKQQSKDIYEFRSTVYPPFFESSDLVSIAELIDGAGKYVLQKYNPMNTLDKDASQDVFLTDELKELQKYFSKYVINCEIR